VVVMAPARRRVTAPGAACVATPSSCIGANGGGEGRFRSGWRWERRRQRAGVKEVRSELIQVEEVLSQLIQVRLREIMSIRRPR
jgi:hypothetical protein